MAGVPDKVKQLVETFTRNVDFYKAGTYNETQLRREYLDPFFTALGWDVENKRGYAEAYKDVIHEYSLKTKDIREAPDYCFRIGGTRKFFVEAKKPGVNVKDDLHPAFQVRSYAWSAKLPLSILTDFEEFAVYDTRIPPDKKDKASTARIMYYNFEEYLQKWGEIEEIFSREAILKGSFDKYVESNKKKRGTAEVDSVFLVQMEEWRKMLARNIALRNPTLSIREINYAVQKTIDRVIFLRICEDRGIEDYGQLMNLQNGVNVYERLKQIYHRADEKYNSGLFHFESEKERSEEPDNLTLDISIDDKVIKDIVKHLYYPDSPYEFSVLPADILGQVYEQFLGKVIRLTPSHQAVIEDKPEVKKAGGVYYTPTYIVNYIVDNTLGRMLTDKTSLKEAAKLKILDPACGSGGFLIGAFQYLIDWHLKYYTADKETTRKYLTVKNPPIHQTANGSYLLTTSEKKRILLNNIYGVDIDSQAVEVTKLSLLLKVLEGESEETISNQMKFFRERALPDLSENIKCGNSLIGPDFYDQMEMSFLDDEEKLRINVFDWETEFKAIMDAGGFDVVIGNPPYLRIQGLQEFYENQIKYFQAHYKSAVKRFDLYLLFIEKGLLLLNISGKLGFICPHKFLNSDFGSGIREKLIADNSIDSIISFGNNLIFSQATTYTCLLFLSNNNQSDFRYYEFGNKDKIQLQNKLFELEEENFALYNQNRMTSEPWILNNDSISKVMAKIQMQPKTLGDIFEKVFQGIVTGADDIYFLKRISDITNDDLIEVYSEKEQQNILLEKAVLKPILKGEDVKRYAKSEFQFYCVYPYKLVDGKTVILQEKEFENLFPNCFSYFKKYKIELRNLRVKYKTNPRYWYSCHRGRVINDFETDKIISQEISDYPSMTIELNKLYHNTTVYSLIPNQNITESIYYWLGILNSNLFWYYLKNTGNVLRGGYFRF